MRNFLLVLILNILFMVIVVMVQHLVEDMIFIFLTIQKIHKDIVIFHTVIMLYLTQDQPLKQDFVEVIILKQKNIKFILLLSNENKKIDLLLYKLLFFKII
jgi:hypothetical protein